MTTKSVTEQLEEMAASAGIAPDELWSMSVAQFALRVAAAKRDARADAATLPPPAPRATGDFSPREVDSLSHNLADLPKKT